MPPVPAAGTPRWRCGWGRLGLSLLSPCGADRLVKTIAVMDSSTFRNRLGIETVSLSDIQRLGPIGRDSTQASSVKCNVLRCRAINPCLAIIRILRIHAAPFA